MNSHNHFTRDIKELGECPKCDEYNARAMNERLATYMGWYKQSTDMYPNAWNDSEGFRRPLPFTTSLDELFKVVEKLGMNVYLSYSPNSKKYRARVYKFGTLADNEEKIYNREAPMALAIALMEKIDEINKES